MSKPTVPAKAPTPTKAPAKAAPTPQTVGAAPAAEAADLLAMSGAASVAEQADRLGNARLQAIQRQRLADKLGQQQGNGRLQHVIALTHRTRSHTPYQLIQLSPLSAQLQQIWTTQSKGVFFERLRNLATPLDADVHAFVRDNLVGNDLWLAQNLLSYGRERNWPIHLRVEREMKGWDDSGGKGAVFEILRTANGTQAGNPDLLAVLNRIFAADTEDAFLAENLHIYGSEANWPVPVVRYDAPFDRNPLSAPGERIIFREEFTYPWAHDFHQIVYTATGGCFDSAGGATTKTIRGLMSGNVNFFIDTAWTGTLPVTVRCEVKCRSNKHVARIDDWIFDKKTTTPTTMTQREGENEFPLGSIYSYQLGPDIGKPGAPDYEHQTILERFEQYTCNISLADLKQEFRNAHPEITTPEQITSYFFGDSGSNGTFTINNLDQVYDRHGGGIPDLSIFQAALKPERLTSEIYADLPQIYEVQPGVAIARYTIRRILKPDGSKMLRKIRVL